MKTYILLNILLKIFIGGFSIYENIGHIINDMYNLEKIYKDEYEKSQISF